MTEWKEPLHLSVLDLGSTGAEVSLFARTAVKRGLLSERAILALANRMEECSDWGDQLVDMGEQETEKLLDLSLNLLGQSYELACGKYDEPQLAIMAIHLLCSIETQIPESGAKSVLRRLAMMNERAQSRIVRQSIADGLELHIATAQDSFVTYLLQDLRTLIERKHKGYVKMLVGSIFRLSPTLNTTGTSVEGALELLYLLSEHFLSIGKYSTVVTLPDLFRAVWDATSLSFSRDKRCVQLCLARAYEAMGCLQKATSLYRECGHDETLHAIEHCLSGDRLYVSQRVGIPLAAGDYLTARELPDGTIAIFVCNRFGGRPKTDFFVVDPQDDFKPEKKALPRNGELWHAVRVVPAPSSELLRLLVARVPEGSLDGDLHTDDMLRSMCHLPALFGNDPVEDLEVWEYDGCIWSQIATRGCPPDRYAITRMGSHCAMLQDKIVLFGGNQVVNAALARSSPETSAGAFILDLKTREWLRVPHPYQLTSYGVIHLSLPPFATVIPVEIEGRTSIAMLREGSSQLNKKGGNELVPKYALDFFGFGQTDNSPSNWLESWFKMNVDTHDRCGYIASTVQCSAMQTGSVLLVIASEDALVVTRNNADGTTQNEYHHPTLEAGITALDMTSFEWRGVSIHNSRLLSSDLKQLQFIQSSDPKQCYIIGLAENELRIFTLSNLNSIPGSFTKALSAKKLLSKKRTAGYKIQKAQEVSVRPLRTCAACRMLESPGITFQCCSRCHVPFYCSRECQRKDWKRGHKQQCRPSPS
jgi:hypothetical protein